MSTEVKGQQTTSAAAEDNSCSRKAPASVPQAQMIRLVVTHAMPAADFTL